MRSIPSAYMEIRTFLIKKPWRGVMHCPYCKREIFTGNVPFLGQDIEDLLAHTGKSITGLADAAKVSYQMVHNWKSNKHRPSPKRLPAIAEYFGISQRDLTNGKWREKFLSGQ